ncbi:ArsR/SmtB family transcription factor [Paenibacillus sp. MBLB4367]|uniref:ArsR/SmtB family transcription factor n=1 Tax=Paenibacillus sp. MBLB4367 TaxID=3384767 RepID=UPI0039083553
MTTPEIAETYVVQSPAQAMALLNPLRAELLALMAEPASAAEIARGMGETAQRINYHLKALEKVGLARRVGTRQVRNLVEVLYQAAARTFVIADSLGFQPQAAQQMRDQGSLAHLITLSDRMKADALTLMEQSDREEKVPSASLASTVRLADERQREAFMNEYVALVEQLVRKYETTAADNASAYRLLAAVYPDPLKEE